MTQNSGKNGEKEVRKAALKQDLKEPEALKEEDNKERALLGKYNLRKKPAISTKFEDI